MSMPLETYEDFGEDYDTNTAPESEDQDDESGDSGFEEELDD